MTILIIRFLNIIMAGLIAGTLFGIWIGYKPRKLSAQTYVEHQQSVINALNTLMPVLGLITIILTLIAAFLQNQNQTAFIILLVAACFLIVSGLVTRFGNQPINSIVMTWNKSDMPNNWTILRDKWWLLHKIRALTVFVAFGLIVWASMRKD